MGYLHIGGLYLQELCNRGSRSQRLEIPDILTPSFWPDEVDCQRVGVRISGLHYFLH